MRRPAWPQSLRGQMIALVLIGLGLAQSLSFVMSRLQHQHAMEAIRDENTLLRIASVVRLLAEMPAGCALRKLSLNKSRWKASLEPVRPCWWMTARAGRAKSS